MLQFFPRKRLVNTALGFYSLPLKKGEDGQYRVNMAMTPFYNLQQDVISCTDENAIDKSYCVPIESFTIMKGPESWLAIRNKDGSLSAGLLPSYVNRGDEQRELSSALMAVDLHEDYGEKGIAIMGYMIGTDRIVFLTRIDFAEEPVFYSKSRTFVKVGKDELFGSFLKNKRLGHDSREILKAAADLYGTVKSETEKEQEEQKKETDKIIDLERA